MDLSRWWQTFNDPVMAELVDLAVAQNKTLQVAGLRVFEARAIVGVATGNLYPQSQGLNGSASQISISENLDAIQRLPDPRTPVRQRT